VFSSSSAVCIESSSSDNPAASSQQPANPGEQSKNWFGGVCELAVAGCGAPLVGRFWPGLAAFFWAAAVAAVAATGCVCGLLLLASAAAASGVCWMNRMGPAG
jgi:hypothetical protein